MPHLGYDVMFLACTAFFLGVTRMMFRFAGEAVTKQDFLASCLCLGGCAATGFFFLGMVWVPIDQFGISHDPAWVDTLMNVGIALLAAGHLVKTWRKPYFFWVIAAAGAYILPSLAPVKAILPPFAQTLLTGVGAFFVYPSLRVWNDRPQISKSSRLIVRSRKELE